MESSIAKQYKETVIIGVESSQETIQGEQLELGFITYTDVSVIEASKFSSNLGMEVSVSEFNTIGEDLELGLKPQTTKITAEHGNKVITDATIAVEVQSENIIGETTNIRLVPSSYYGDGISTLYDSKIDIGVNLDHETYVGELESILITTLSGYSGEARLSAMIDTAISMLVGYNSSDIVGETVEIGLLQSTFYNHGTSAKYDTTIPTTVELSQEDLFGEVVGIGVNLSILYGDIVLVDMIIDTAISMLVGYNSSDIVGETVEIGLLQSTFYKHGTSAKYDTTIPTTVELSQEDLFGEVVGIGVNLSILYGDIVLVDMIIDTAISMLVGYNSSDIVGETVEIGLLQSTFYKHGTSAKYDTTIPTTVELSQEDLFGEVVGIGVNLSILYGDIVLVDMIIDTAISMLVGYNSSDIVGETVEIGLLQSTFYKHGTSAKYDTTIPTTVELSQEDLFGEVVGIGVNLSILYGDIVLVDMIIDTAISMLVGYNSSDIVGETVEIGLLQSTFYKHGTSAKYDTTIPTTVELSQEDLFGEVVGIGVNLSILYGDIVLVDMIIDTAISMLVGYNSSDIVGETVEIGLLQSTFYKHGTSAKYDTTIRTSVNTHQENIVGETVEVRVNNSSSVSITQGTRVSYDDTITFGVSTVEENITQGDYQEVAFKPSTLTNTRPIIPKTATPRLLLGCYGGILAATIGNNDENAANIEVTGAITRNLTSVPSGGSTILYASGQLLVGLVTVRARATADGKAPSSLISRTYNMDFCSF